LTRIPISFTASLNAYLKAKDAHVGVVKTFAAPSVPKPPPSPTDLAAELASYDAAEPGGGASPSPNAGSQQSAGEDVGNAREFLQFLEADIPKQEAHH
jgi:F-type H+-transporting ATPase subunit h